VRVFPVGTGVVPLDDSCAILYVQSCEVYHGHNTLMGQSPAGMVGMKIAAATQAEEEDVVAVVNSPYMVDLQPDLIVPVFVTGLADELLVLLW
jgi:hypothetical protein